MKKILSYFVCILIGLHCIESCSKSIEESSGNKIGNPLKTVPLVEYYQRTTFPQIVEVFSEAGFTLAKSNSILNQLNEYANQENITFTKYELFRFKPGAYNFVSTSSNHQFKVSFILEEEPQANQYRETGSSCTCSGCADGCNPKRHGNGDCYCTTCTFVGSGVNCTKTESIKSADLVEDNAN